MKKISNTIVGIPLRQTGPAAVEKFIVDKVRSDLGEATDFVTVKPMLRVDTEDGDLSGNIANGYGNVELDVKGAKVYLPFIIHEKTLLPFDAIRLGDQEVPYDIGKLQKLVFALKQKVESNAAGGEDGIAEVVDYKDIPTHNGFLGTIMDIRDSHRATDAAGMGLWDGLSFGHLDDERLVKRASADIDVSEVFNDVSVKLASATVYPEKAIDQFLTTIEKEAYDQAVERIKTAAPVEDTVERAEVKREFKKLDEDKLVNTKRVLSGNNIVFPLLNNGQFEYRSGRVYHKLVNASGKSVNSGYSSVVIDKKKEYRLLKSNEEFMTTLQEADRLFEPQTIEAKAMITEGMYAFELETDTLVHPFLVGYTHKEDAVHNGVVISVPERVARGAKPSNQDFQNSIFDNLVSAKYVGSKGNKEVLFLIMKNDAFKGPSVVTKEDLSKMIMDLGTDNIDIKRANMIVQYFYADEYVLLSKSQKVFPLKKQIEGSFQKPNSYFDHMAKEAAYEQADKVTLYVKKDPKPRKYDLKWTFTNMADSPGGKAQYKIEKKEMTNLSEDSVRQTLQLLGFDMRRTEQFFEITKRNGRSATFNLPSKQKAQNVTPEDVANQQKKLKFKGIANSTLNANNFMPIFEDAVAQAVSGLVMGVAPSVPEKLMQWDNFLKTSFETARDLEKVATDLSGANWFELAMMTNLKYQMDKMAHEIASGSYVELESDTLEKVASLKGNISDATNQLIHFNRTQLTKHAQPMVSPKLVKNAINQLEGLYAYASMHERLNGGLDKQAGLFNAKQVKEITGTIDSKKDELNRLMNHFNEANIEMRAFRNSAKPSQTKQTAAQVKVDEARDKVKSAQEELNAMLDNRGKLEQQDYKKTSAATVGLTGLAMGSLGVRQASKDHEE